MGRDCRTTDTWIFSSRAYPSSSVSGLACAGVNPETELN